MTVAELVHQITAMTRNLEIANDREVLNINIITSVYTGEKKIVLHFAPEKTEAA